MRLGTLFCVCYVFIHPVYAHYVKLGTIQVIYNNLAYYDVNNARVVGVSNKIIH